MKTARIAAATTLAVVGAAAAIGSHYLNRDTAERIALGRELYLANCASCHGVDLEGQPNWQSPGRAGRLPAPPHDETGHTWHHADALLLAIIRQGTAAVVGGGYESDMPGFAGSLTDAQSEAVLDYIKSTWPAREAAHQRKISGK